MLNNLNGKNDPEWKSFKWHKSVKFDKWGEFLKGNFTIEHENWDSKRY